MPDAAGAIRVMRSLPFERPLLPLIYEADGEHAKEDHHRPEAERAELTERDRPGKQEGNLEVENDEQDRHEIEAHVELHARVIEGIEAAFIGGQFFRIGAAIGDEERSEEQRKTESDRDRDEHDERQIILQQLAHRRFPASAVPRKSAPAPKSLRISARIRSGKRV